MTILISGSDSKENRCRFVCVNMSIPEQENVTHRGCVASLSQLNELLLAIGWNSGFLTASPNTRPFICSLGQTALFRLGWCFIGVDPLLNSGHSPDVIIPTQNWTKGEDVHSWHGRSCPVPLIFPSLSHYFHDTIWLSTLSLPTSPSPLKDLESAQLLVLIMFLLHPYRLRVQVRLRADLGESGRREAGREGGRRRLPLDILPGIWGYISQQTRLDMLATSGGPH